MYYATGFHDDEIVELAAMVHAIPMVNSKSWPPILGLFKSVVVALTYLRRNRVQCELAETYGVSQATISRAIAVMTPLLAKVLQKYVPTADELAPGRQYVVDGTLLPCWSWASRPELYSGKHQVTGVNVQVACTLEGVLVWISDPIDGSRHDTHCLRESGVLLSHGAENWIGDKGYVGNGMLTPIKKPSIVTSWTGRRRSKPRLTRSGMSSSRRSPTSRRGGSCTQIIGVRSKHSPKPSRQSLRYISTHSRE